MLQKMYVNPALTGMITDFLEQQKSIDAQKLRASILPIATNTSQRLSLAEWIALLEDVSDILLNKVGIGLDIGACIKPIHTGVLGYLALSSSTLAEALMRFERFNRLVYDGNSMSFLMNDSTVQIAWGVEQGKPGQLPDETAIAAFLTFVRQIVGGHVKPLLVNFVNDKPDDISVYEDFFGCPVTFSGICSYVTFSKAFLLLPIQYSDPGLNQLLEKQAESLLKALPSPDEFEQKLRQALIHSLHTGEPTLENVANRLAVSPRTLQRRLSDKGVQFQAILERTRYELAQQYFYEKRLSLTDIALLLGYSEQSAFNRAFKRWTGKSPRQMRMTL